MTIRKIAGAAVIVACFVAGSAGAEEQTMKFQLVTTQVSGSFDDVPNAEGRSLGVGKYAGGAVFEDRRIACKDFVLTMERAGKEGNYTGYSTYTFLNGDSLNLKFDGGWSPKGHGGETTRCSPELEPSKAPAERAASTRPRSHGQMPSCGTARSS